MFPTPHAQFSNLRQGTLAFIHPEYLAVSGASHLPCLEKCGTSRPCVYLGFTGHVSDLRERICWFVPISSKMDKYRAIYANKIERFGQCDTLTECTLLGEPRMVLFQNMFPATLDFIREKYTDKSGNDICLSKEDTSRVLKMASDALRIEREKGRYLIFDNPNIIIDKLLAYARQKNAPGLNTRQEPEQSYNR